jgi:hypothetical protein
MHLSVYIRPGTIDDSVFENLLPFVKIENTVPSPPGVEPVSEKQITGKSFEIILNNVSPFVALNSIVPVTYIEIILADDHLRSIHLVGIPVRPAFGVGHQGIDSPPIEESTTVMKQVGHKYPPIVKTTHEINTVVLRMPEGTGGKCQISIGYGHVCRMFPICCLFTVEERVLCKHFATCGHSEKKRAQEEDRDATVGPQKRIRFHTSTVPIL